MPRPARISLEQAEGVKADLWTGMHPKQVAELRGISVPMIYLIRRGEAHPEARWPDGSTGPMTEAVRPTIRVNHPDAAWIKDCPGIYHKLLRAAQQAGFVSVKAWTEFIAGEVLSARAAGSEAVRPLAFTAYDRSVPLPQDWAPSALRRVADLPAVDWETAVRMGGEIVERMGVDEDTKRALCIVMAGWTSSVASDQFALVVDMIKESIHAQGKGEGGAAGGSSDAADG